MVNIEEQLRIAIEAWEDEKQELLNGFESQQQLIETQQRAIDAHQKLIETQQERINALQRALESFDGL